jgi:hypothetical protein
MRHILSKEIIKEIKTGLKQFGEYSYYDKGAFEVMEVDAFVEKMKLLSKEELADIF